MVDINRAGGIGTYRALPLLPRSSRFNAWESVANERGPKSGTDSYDAGNESGEI